MINLNEKCFRTFLISNADLQKSILKLKFFCKAAKFYEVVNFLVYIKKTFNCLSSALVNFCNFFQWVYLSLSAENLIMFSNLFIFGARTLQKRSFIFELNIVRKRNFCLNRLKLSHYFQNRLLIQYLHVLDYFYYNCQCVL